jgi:hypothetical protein
VRVASALSVVLATLVVALEVVELVELVFVVAVRAAARALSRSEVEEEIAEIDIMPLPEVPDTRPGSLSAGGKYNFKAFDSYPAQER